MYGATGLSHSRTNRYVSLSAVELRRRRRRSATGRTTAAARRRGSARRRGRTRAAPRPPARARARTPRGTAARAAGASSARSSVPRIAIVTTASSASTTTNVRNCTDTTAAGMTSRANRALRISAPWSSSDVAAGEQRLREEDPHHQPAQQEQRIVLVGERLEHDVEQEPVRRHEHERVDEVPGDAQHRPLVLLPQLPADELLEQEHAGRTLEERLGVPDHRVGLVLGQEVAGAAHELDATARTGRPGRSRRRRTSAARRAGFGGWATSRGSSRVRNVR